MSECYCMHVVVQYPSFVVLASLECLGLFLRGDIESLVVDAFETAYDYCISFLLCLKNTLVQIDILYIHFLSIDYHFASNTLRCIVYDMFLIDQTVHLRSQSHKLRDAMSIVFFLDYWTRQLLVEIEERWERRELTLVRFMFVVVHELSVENSCYPVLKSRLTCTSHTSCVRCCENIPLCDFIIFLLVQHMVKAGKRRSYVTRQSSKNTKCKWNTRKQRIAHGHPWYALVRMNNIELAHIIIHTKYPINSERLFGFNDRTPRSNVNCGLILHDYDCIEMTLDEIRPPMFTENEWEYLLL